MDRRQFLGAAASGSAALTLVRPEAAQAKIVTGTSSWEDVKALFDLKPGMVNMAGFFLASHPQPVRIAIERHRRGLDQDSHGYIENNIVALETAVRAEAARYMHVDADELAFTDSTTMGLGLLYSGMRLRPGQEILTDTRDHIVTTLAAAEGAERSGASLRQVSLYSNPASVSVDEVASNVRKNLRDNTRLLAITWVHSGTGVKMPIREVSEVVHAHNRGKSSSERTLLAVDGVHGFGIEDVAISSLGADFFVAGIHKWLTGPRGTGLIWGRKDAWPFVRPTIPTFDRMWRAGPVEQMPLAGMNTPGGFHSFEHRWAVADAFKLHSAIGKSRIADRIHHLNSLAKSEMAKVPKIRMHTPISPALSAGIIAFEVDGVTPARVVEQLHDRGIIASVTPGFYRPSLARIAPSLLTDEDDVRRTMRALATL